MSRNTLYAYRINNNLFYKISQAAIGDKQELSRITDKKMEKGISADTEKTLVGIAVCEVQKFYK